MDKPLEQPGLFSSSLIVAAFAVAMMLTVSTYPHQAAAQVVDTTEVRIVQPLNENWRFVQDDELTETEALSSTADDWEPVTLPHTWNAEDAASLEAEDYVRGLGWYRLEFPSPEAGARHWLEFGAASMVADVWLNGQHLGQHKGAVTQFRFDVTDLLVPGEMNVLLVRADNSEPESDSDVTAIPPMRGDFNISGGLHRHVALISTPDAAHFDLADLGGPGVYATTAPGLTASAATVNVRTKLRNDGQAPGDYVVRVSLLGADGQVAASAEQPINLAPAADAELAQDLGSGPHSLDSAAADVRWNLRANVMLPKTETESQHRTRSA